MSYKGGGVKEGIRKRSVDGTGMLDFGYGERHGRPAREAGPGVYCSVSRRACVVVQLEWGPAMLRDG